MLERRHGCFDSEPCEVHIVSGQNSAEDNYAAVLALCRNHLD